MRGWVYIYRVVLVSNLGEVMDQGRKYRSARRLSPKACLFRRPLAVVNK